MRLTDQIWGECSERGLSGIDDIEKIQITGSGLKQLMLEYEVEFDEKISTTSELSDHIGMKVEVVPFIKNEKSKEYKILSPIF